MKITERELLAQFEGLTVERLEVCVTEAWVRPAMAEEGRVYDEVDLARIRLILDLSEDMMVNDDALPIILSLIDQVHALKRRLRALDQAVPREDDGIRREIAERLRQRFAPARKT